jgi:hypothetical protein
MTVLLFAVGGLLAGLGTRLCALAFVAAAVFGARQPQPLLAALTTWTAATAAGWVLLDERSPRALAVPLLGAAAVLAAAGAPNGAVVLALWAIGTIAAVLSRGDVASGARWALGLVAGDVVFAIAVATTAGRGFEGWPATLKLPGAIAMLAAAAVRTPLVAGPPDDTGSKDGHPVRSFAACLILRAQIVMLIGLAIAAAGDLTTMRVLVVLGALAFAGAVIAGSRATVDGMQEIGAVAMVAGGAALGWLPAGWAWGALAAGTLIHHLRFTVDSRPAGRIADAIGRGGGIGLPFLPVSVALLEGAFAASTDLAIVVALAVLIGLAGRTRIAPTRRDPSRELDPVRAWAPVVAAFAASVIAPALSLPRPPGGGSAPWPGAWAAALIAIAAVIGSQIPGLSTERAADGDVSNGVAVFRRAATERFAVLDVIATDVVLWAGLTSVAAAGVVLWLIGLGRGFL